MNRIRATLAVLAVPGVLTALALITPASEASVDDPEAPLFCVDSAYLPHTSDAAEAWMSRCP